MNEDHRRQLGQCVELLGLAKEYVAIIRKGAVSESDSEAGINREWNLRAMSEGIEHIDEAISSLMEVHT